MDIDDLRAICLAFPAAEEEVKWETVLCFMVARKMFCTVRLDITPPRPSFKADKETFDELSQSAGFIPAPYMAHAKWVQLVNAAHISRAELEKHLRRSYELIKAKLPKKVKQEWGLE